MIWRYVRSSNYVDIFRLRSVLLAPPSVHGDGLRPSLSLSLGIPPIVLTDSDVGDRSVRGVFDFSYKRLDDAHARAFRLLSFFPGRAFDTAAAAAMLGNTSETTVRLLDELAYSYLIIEVSVNRYRYHDLLRQYARELEYFDFPDEKSAALAKWRQWYLDQIRSNVAELLDGHTAEDSPIHALEWLEEERANVFGLADRSGCYRVWRLRLGVGRRFVPLL